MKQPYYSSATSAAVRNVGYYERLASVAAGPWLLLGGVRRGLPGGIGLALLGAELLYRGATGHCPVYTRLGLSSAGASGGSLRVSKSIGIARSPDEVYSFWRNFENLPRFMKHLELVRTLDERRSHWAATGPAGSAVAWDAEITDDRPGELIAWRSLPGAQVDNSGSVSFAPAPGDRGTIVKVELEYAPPAGELGAAVAALFGEAPDQQIEGDLRRLRSMLEAGEIPTTAGQPNGERSTIGALLQPAPPKRPTRRDTDPQFSTVEEASDESFPASDPPGWIGGLTDDAEHEVGA